MDTNYCKLAENLLCLIMTLWTHKNEKRTQILKLRVTTREKSHIVTVAKKLGISVSSYVRQVIFGNVSDPVDGHNGQTDQV